MIVLDIIGDVVGVRDDNGAFTLFRAPDDAISELAGNEAIIAYGVSATALTKLAEGFEHMFEDYEIRRKWRDLKSIIRKETGDSVRLSRVADSTLGTGLDMDITRLKQSHENIDMKLRDSTRVIKKLAEYVIDYGQVSYSKQGGIVWAEIEVDERV